MVLAIAKQREQSGDNVLVAHQTVEKQCGQQS